MKTIGILGGMGPEASCHFYNRIIKYCQQRYNAVQDNEYPPMILYSLPLTGFDETGIRQEKMVLEQLMKGFDKLKDAGSDFIVMPCNTSHHFIEDLRERTGIPVMSIIDKAAEKVVSHRIGKTGLLVSETTLKLGLYERALSGYGIEVINAKKEEQDYVTKAIRNVMAGKSNGWDSRTLSNIMKRMREDGAHAIILGCTELPLIISSNGNHHHSIKIFDSLEILAESAVEEARRV